MNTTELQTIRNLFKDDVTFEKDKMAIVAILDNVGSLSKNKQESLFAGITECATRSDWSRRRLYGLVNAVFSDLASLKDVSEEVLDYLESYLDAMEGNCSWQSVIKLNRDPNDQLELSNYVRSKKWVNKDFYDDII